eukprot:1973293-Amphidinium_carterae.2
MANCSPSASAAVSGFPSRFIGMRNPDLVVSTILNGKEWPVGSGGLHGGYVSFIMLVIPEEGIPGPEHCFPGKSTAWPVRDALHQDHCQVADTNSNLPSKERTHLFKLIHASVVRIEKNQKSKPEPTEFPVIAVQVSLVKMLSLPVL